MVSAPSRSILCGLRPHLTAENAREPHVFLSSAFPDRGIERYLAGGTRSRAGAAMNAEDAE